MPHPYTKLLIDLNYAYLAAYENEKNSIFGLESTRKNIRAKIQAVDFFIDIIENGASHPHAIERETIIKSKRLGDLYLLLVAQDSSLDKKTIQNINSAATPKPRSCLPNTPEEGTLHHAASTSLDTVKNMLKQGAYLNMLDEAGDIPISKAASTDIALELLRNGSHYMLVYESGYQFLMNFGDSMTDVNATIKLLDYIRILRFRIRYIDAHKTEHTEKLLIAAQALRSVLLLNLVLPNDIRDALQSKELNKLYRRLLNSNLPTDKKDMLREYENESHNSLNSQTVVSNLLMKIKKAQDRKDEDCLQSIISHPSIHKVMDVEGNQALHLAVLTRSVSSITALLNNPNIQANARNLSGDTALIIAVDENSLACVKALLTTNNIEVDARNSNGNSALHLAVIMKYTAIIDALLPRTRAFHRVNNRNESPLYIAANAGDAATVEKIIAQLLQSPDLKIDAEDSNGYTLMDYAAHVQSQSAIHKLLEHHADINGPNCFYLPPVYYAADTKFKAFMKNCGASIKLDLTRASYVLEIDEALKGFKGDANKSCLQLVRYLFVIHSEIEIEYNSDIKDRKSRKFLFAKDLYTAICMHAISVSRIHDDDLLDGRLGDIYSMLLETNADKPDLIAVLNGLVRTNIQKLTMYYGRHSSMYQFAGALIENYSSGSESDSESIQFASANFDADGVVTDSSDEERTQGQGL